MFKTAIALLLCSLMVMTGCTTFDAAIQKQLPRICSSARTFHSSFMIVAATGKLSQRTVARENAAFNEIDDLCNAPPENQTGADVLARAAALYLTMTTAAKEAERVQ